MIADKTDETEALLRTTNARQHTNGREAARAAAKMGVLLLLTVVIQIKLEERAPRAPDAWPRYFPASQSSALHFCACAMLYVIHVWHGPKRGLIRKMRQWLSSYDRLRTTNHQSPLRPLLRLNLVGPKEQPGGYSIDAD